MQKQAHQRRDAIKRYFAAGLPTTAGPGIQQHPGKFTPFITLIMVMNVLWREFYVAIVYSAAAECRGSHEAGRTSAGAAAGCTELLRDWQERREPKLRTYMSLDCRNVAIRAQPRIRDILLAGRGLLDLHLLRPGARASCMPSSFKQIKTIYR